MKSDIQLLEQDETYMEKVLIPDDYSLASYYVESYFNDTRLSNASCFFYEAGEKLYLITNWHVVTGKDANTFEHLSANAAEPNLLKVHIFEKDTDESFQSGYILTVSLLDSKGNHLWIEQKNEIDATMTDVVAIPVNIPLKAKVFPVNCLEEPFNENTTVSIKDDVFIIGYPFGIQCSSLPIWKRASIASEPCVDICDKPMMFVDTTTKPSMSGSPVLYKEKRTTTLINNKENQMSRYFTKFIGVYSGRVYAKNIYEAQLGIVWKASIIENLLSHISFSDSENPKFQK